MRVAIWPPAYKADALALLSNMKGLYAIADTGLLSAKGVSLATFAEQMRLAGVKTLQLRDKWGTDQEILTQAQHLSQTFQGSEAVLVMNDRLNVMLLAGWSAIHVGQDDMSPAVIRPAIPAGIIGVSTHTPDQVLFAEQGLADYVAIGPVFATGTKLDAANAVGLAGVRMARERTRKPLVAIGGITLENCRSVMDAGADAVAVISGLFRPEATLAMVARSFIEQVG